MQPLTVRVFPSHDHDLAGDVHACVGALGVELTADRLEKRLRKRWPSVHVVPQNALARLGYGSVIYVFHDGALDAKRRGDGPGAMHRTPRLL